MAHYGYRVGNTSVVIQDLGPGGNAICGHCGKNRIRYLATVSQDLVDTARRHYSGERPMERQDAAIISLAVLDGKTRKVADVGCVCLGKYFVDCGVDAGLRARLIEKGLYITRQLQSLAALDGLRTPEKIEACASMYREARVLYHSWMDFFRGTVDPAAVDWAERSRRYTQFNTLNKKVKSRFKGFDASYEHDNIYAAIHEHYNRVEHRVHQNLRQFKNAGRLAEAE
jgi:hypothetical protein